MIFSSSCRFIDFVLNKIVVIKKVVIKKVVIKKVNKKVVIHVGINDILRDSSQSSIDGLLQNIKNMALKCTKFGVKNIFISGLVYTTRINIGILEKIHVVIQNFCQENGWFYVDNRNIRGKHLYKDGLHLMEEGKIILARNLIFCLNKATSNYFLDGNFLGKHTHHATVKI